MGLKINTLAEIPNSVSKSYYLYILDYYNWNEPIANTLRDSFDKIAQFAAKNDSVVIQGISESHFYSELLSWKSINGIDPKELLPALMITTIHPQYFLAGNDKQILDEKIPEDNLIFLEIGKICKSPGDVIKLIEQIFKDIQERKQIKNFQVKKQFKAGIGKILNDTIILEPNIAGVGVNINNLFRFLGGK